MNIGHFIQIYTDISKAYKAGVECYDHCYTGLDNEYTVLLNDETQLKATMYLDSELSTKRHGNKVVLCSVYTQNFRIVVDNKGALSHVPKQDNYVISGLPARMIYNKARKEYEKYTKTKQYLLCHGYEKIVWCHDD